MVAPLQELGEDGLHDRSCRPHHSPGATKTEIVGKIIYLRQHYHFGPRKISMYLARYHDIAISPSGIGRILKRLDKSRLPASQRHERRWKRYEKQLPGSRLQVDVKFIEPIGGARRKHYQFTAIDDCTRIQVLGVYPATTSAPRSSSSTTSSRNSRSASSASRPTTAPNAKPASTGTSSTAGSATSTSNPRPRRLNGKVERSHRIDAEEFYRLLDGVVIDNTKLFNQKLQEWEDYYNFNIPHGGLDGQTPYERQDHQPGRVSTHRQLHNRSISSYFAVCFVPVGRR